MTFLWNRGACGRHAEPLLSATDAGRGEAMRTYEALGVRPIINASGTITTLGGSRMPPEVLAAMVEAAQAYVHLEELHLRAGEALAKRIGVPAAFVSCGAASGLQLSAAACLTGTDPRAIT